MPKKTISSKRVPAEVKAFLSAYDPQIREIALRARALVFAIVPDVLEQIDVPAKMLAYGFKATYKDMLCMISPQKTYVNFGFPRGAEMTDPAKRLVGTGKRARHVKLNDVTRVDTPELRALLQESVAQITK